MQFASYPSLAGKNVYVTGGGSGIGADIVAAFALQGARVAFADRDAPASEALVAALPAGRVRADLHALRPVGRRCAA